MIGVSSGKVIEMIRPRQKLVVFLLTLLLPSTSWSQGVAQPQGESVGPPLFVVTVQGKDGFIDRKGKIVIEPTFEQAYPFTDGLAAVQKQGAWGFIDTKGQVVIEPQFVMVGLFSDGLASFQNKRYTDPWGYMDKSGKVVIKPQFDYAEGFRKGIARVGFETTQSKLLGLIADVGGQFKYRFIDRNGKYVPEPSATHYANGKPGELIPFRKDDLAGYFNAKGEVVIKPQFQVASAFSDGLANVCKDGLFGYIDTRGDWVISPRFEHPGDFSEGLAGVPLGKEGWGFIDRTGKVVIPAKFAWVLSGFRHGVAEVAFDSKRGYINKTGEWVWEPSD